MPGLTSLAAACCVSLLLLACQPAAAAKETLFVGADGLHAVDLDTGTHRKVQLQGKPLAYRAVPLAGGQAILLAYVDDELRPGYALVSSTGRLLHRRHGFAPYPVGEKLLLGVKLSEVQEGVSYSSAVEVVPLGGKPRTMPHSLPLSLLAVPAESPSLPGAEVEEPPLILTYRRSGHALNLLYPWDKRLTLTAIDREGAVRWVQELVTDGYLADMNLVAATPEAFLLFGLYNQFAGEYVALSRADGSILWRRTEDVIPWTVTRYPYLHFGEALLVHCEEAVASFPVQRPAQAEVGKLTVDLSTGDIRYEQGSEWVRAVRANWEAAAAEAAVEPEREERLPDGAMLHLGRDRLTLRRDGRELWARERIPAFGEGLELAKAGERLLLLVERPRVKLGLAAQGIPYLLEAETGADFTNPAGEGAAWLEPVEVNGKALILTETGVRWIAGTGG